MIRLSEEEAKKLFGVSGDPEMKPKKKSVVRGKKMPELYRQENLQHLYEP